MTNTLGILYRKAISKRIPVSAYYLLFLLWPLAAVVKALANFHNRHAKNVFWLFCIFFGFVFIYADPAGTGGSDSARYAADLIYQHDKQFSFSEVISMIYNPQTNKLDLYQPLMTWLVSLITDNPRILFMMFAVVFGFFYSRNVWMVLEKINRPLNALLFLLVAYLFLINPIWNINGVRMWTAAHVILYGTLRFFLKNDKKGAVWIGLSVLFHFSFLLPVGLFIAWVFLPKKIDFYFALYIFTAFFLEIGLTQASGLMSFLPDIFQPRVSSYTNDAYAEKIYNAKQEISGYVQIAWKVANLLAYSLVIFIYVTRIRWGKQHPEASRLFVFSLFLGSFANIASGVPSGGRFVSLSTFLLISVAIMVFGQRRPIRIPITFKYFSLLLLGYVVVFNFRLGLDYIGISTIIGNPISALFARDTKPLIDLFKEFIL